MLNKLKLGTYRLDNIYKTHNLQTCNVTVDADTLTATIGTLVTLTATVEPPGTYDIIFKYGGVPLNPIPISTDLSGTATLPVDTTGQTQGLYDVTAEVVNPTPPPTESCISSPITLAITTVPCEGIFITDPQSPVTAYIGDVIHVSVSANITEPSVVELRIVELDIRIGSCIIDPSGTCMIDQDTTGAPPGTYHAVAYIGYGSAEQCASDPVEVTLQNRPGNIVILSIPPGPRIYLDDIDTGVNASAMISDIIPDIEHIVTLKLSGYTDYTSEPINIGSGETWLISTVMSPIVPPVGTGSLNVTSTPSGAEFFIFSETAEIANDITPTSTPITNIPAGIYAYDAGISYNGTSGAMGSVIIKAGETTDLNIPLPDYSPDNGIIAIESIPVGADIYIDGEPINTKTSYATMMAPGPHTYELRLPGYITASGEFTVVTGYDIPTIVSVQLQPEGAGESSGIVLVVGAAVLGMMALSKPK
jgi:hypothetical protein